MVELVLEEFAVEEVNEGFILIISFIFKLKTLNNYENILTFLLDMNNL